MYSNKPSVNILTSLLVEHGVRHAVVCPGSRNAPIVHNLNECPAIHCYPVTDERSAGFFALGIAQATDEPVVVCVTSGTALLNVAPAVAEAHYQHQSLVVISADRPVEWIDQLDGQTLRQPGALEPWVKKTVTLPDLPSSPAPHLPPLHWHCNRLVNEALMEAASDTRPCVHINVPIAEPLFEFTVEQLPEERVMRRFTPATDYNCLPQQLIDDLTHARRPLIVFGQLSPRRFHYEGMDALFSHIIVLHEALAPFTSVSPFEDVLDDALLPDFILYAGDAIVSKRLKHFLRQAKDAITWRISLTGEVEDTFQNMRDMVVGDAECILQSLNNKMCKLHPTYAKDRSEYRSHWLHLLSDARRQLDSVPLTFSEEGAVRLLEQQLLYLSPTTFHLHYANSTAIRIANRYAKGHPVWCNRGTNGIEGTLSTAAGFAAALHPHPSTLNPHPSTLHPQPSTLHPQPSTLHPPPSTLNPPPSTTFCVIGDLSFFYDQNALWNTFTPHLNLRILLLNNGHGAIFDQLPGLNQSPVADTFVAGRHHTTAEGVCMQNGISRRHATDMQQLQDGIHWLADTKATGCRLLEVML